MRCLIIKHQKTKFSLAKSEIGSVKTSLDNTSKLILFELSTFPFFRSETQFRLLWQLPLVVKSRSHWWLDPSLLSDVLNARWTCAFQALS